MADIAVILHTTFTRFEFAKRTIESFLVNPRFRIYVADTGELTPEKLRYYSSIDVDYNYMGWDTSPSITRNFLVDKIKEPYIFKIDDDFEYGEKVREQDIIDLMNKLPYIGLCGMSVRSAEYKSQFIFNLEKGENMVMRSLNTPALELDGIRYLPCDVTPDCWIARREIFPECNWDERYHVSEGLHTDFFAHIKYNSNWKVAYMPDCIMYTFKHDPDVKVPDEIRKKSFYNKKRFRHLDKDDQYKKFCEKWNVKTLTR